MTARIVRSFIVCILILSVLTLAVPRKVGRLSNSFPTTDIKQKFSAVDYMNSSDKYGFTTIKSRFSRHQILQTLNQYPDFNEFLDRESSFTIPGLENTFVGKDCKSMVPQGLCMLDNCFLTTAYDADSQCGSVIYAISSDSQRKLKCVIELPVKIHAGGITFDGNNIWICGDDEITADSRSGVMYSISAEHIKALIENGNRFEKLGIDAISKYNISNSASFCTFFRNRLWVGTFTNSSQQEVTYGCIMSYDINSTAHLNGEAFLNFESFLLLPNRAQGICFFERNNETYMALSRSYARNSHVGKTSFISEIRVYKPTFDANNPEKMTKKGTAISVLNTPPMIEELCFDSISNRLYAIFESGASKYSTDSTSSLRRCKYIFDKIAAIDINRLIE